MHTIEEMRTWNYEKAWDFFTKNAVGKFIPETLAYLNDTKMGPVFDLRGQKVDMRMMEWWAKQKTLFVIDGASASGKSTLAKKIGEQCNIKVLDIDEMCIQWMNRKMQGVSPIKRYELLMNFDRLTDEFILKNLEQEVIKASKNGRKSVILVGVFLEIIYRAIIGETIGSHFTNVVGILLHESSFERVVSNDRAREKQFNFNQAGRDYRTLAYEYKYVEDTLKGEGWMFGVGMTQTYLTDKEAFND